MAAISSRRGRLALLFLAFALVLSVSLTSAQAPAPQPPSGCEICRDKQDCSRAFQNQPGQFCGNWLDPGNNRLQDTCVRETTSSCKCQPGKKQSSSPVASNNSSSSSDKKKEENKKKIWYIIGVLVFAGLVGLLVFMYCRSQRNNEDDHYDDYPAPQPEVVVQKTYVQEAPHYAAAPVYAPAPQYAAAPPQYVSAQPQYVAAQPHYTTAPAHSYSQSPRRGGGGFNGAGVAVGAAAGLVGGMLIGHALGDAGDSDDIDVGTYADAATHGAFLEHKVSSVPCDAVNDIEDLRNKIHATYHWLDLGNNRLQDTCARETTSSCKCQPGKKQSSSPVASNDSNSSSDKKKKEENKKKLWYIIGVLVFAGLVGLLVFMYCQRSSEDDHYDDYPAPQPEVVVQRTYVQEAPHYPAAPVYAPAPQYAAAPPQYVSAQPQYVAAQPHYTTAPAHSYSQSPRRGGGSFNGAGVAVGAAAGLVGGMLIGHALGDAGDSDDIDVGTYAGDF
ncbi:hypothetical protein ATCC90586_003853 [Pythium insidiosum]|nr:hypothetical protein ATCC90586_003853 [Pythium insidiosum]